MADRKQSLPDPAGDVEHVVATLSLPERMLVVLKRELYDGDWDELVADLRARLSGGPYIVKLATRIEDDLERVARLRQMEQRLGVDLGDYVTM